MRYSYVWHVWVEPLFEELPERRRTCVGPLDGMGRCEGSGCLGTGFERLMERWSRSIGYSRSYKMSVGRREKNLE